MPDSLFLRPDVARSPGQSRADLAAFVREWIDLDRVTLLQADGVDPFAEAVGRCGREVADPIRRCRSPFSSPRTTAPLVGRCCTAEEP
jgi:hypothetical protein